ncbi:MAG: AGE family epimerase/isomerase [Reichenbachiella sp.]
MVDIENGGFYGRITGENNLDKQADKGVILNTRILWTFSISYLELKNPKYLAIAKRAYEYLKEHFIDQTNGGVYWSLDCKGVVTNSKKQIYAQAFAIYGLSEYYKISEDKDVLMLAIELYNLIEDNSLDKTYGGYLEAFDEKWNLLDDFRLSEKDQNEAKTMNTHLHVLEAYTNLYMVWKDENLKSSLNSLIQLFLERFVQNNGHFHLFFDEQWNLKSNEVSYGHDVEGGWLLHEAALVLKEESLIKKTSEAAVLMTRASLKGLDEDGGLMNHGNTENVIDRNKDWWPQAEALVGLVNTYAITNDQRYLDVANKVWRFIQSNMIDHENGEWFGTVDQYGSVDKLEDKAGPWKCPYHNGRAMIEIIRRL